MAKRYVILGNGVAGVTAAMTLRARDADARITVVGDESPYFFSRTALMYALTGRITRRDMEPFERRVYRESRLDLVFDRAVDLDADARTVTLAKGDVLPWDALLIATGSSPRALDAPGLTPRPAGLAHMVSMRDLDDCERLAQTASRAVVVGGGLIGVELVEAWMHRGLPTTLLVREPWYWPIALCREEGERVTAHLRHHGVDVRHGDSLASADVRDGSLRAITTTRGDTLPCDALGVCIGVEPAVRWLSTVRTAPKRARGIVVDDTLATSLPGVWAAGDCAEVTPEGSRSYVEQIWYSAKRQGALAARNMTAPRPERYAPPTFYNSAKFFDVEYTTVGELRAVPDDARSVYRAHPTRFITQRIVHHRGRVLGFNLLGSRWDHTLLTQWIDEARPLDQVMARLHEAQFDVEFGRADLRAMRETELPLTREVA